ncbi:MAG: 26S protease regulatory subunit, partial [Phycisphaerae bacterium]
CLALEKHSQALVIVEELLRLPDTPPAARLLQAKLSLRTGEIEYAVRQYKQAVADDENLRDPALEDQLGIDAQPDSDVVDGRIREAHDPDHGHDVNVERPQISFDDVGGMDHVKSEISAKIIYPLEHPEIYAAYGKKAGGGLMMYGPPGCGKTHLARATAGQIRAKFISVGISDVLEMWIGQSERNLHDIFESARAAAPCVLFFDEVDALGADRADMRRSGGRQLINQFLSEMDGVQANNEGVLVLAATNAPWHVDSAFRRPGRFDRLLFVPPPDETARAAILRIMLKNKPAGEVDVDHVVRKLKGFSGADLKGVVEAAVEKKLEEAIRQGALQPLTTNDLIRAGKSVKPSTREWFATAKNYALYSNQGGLYDDVIEYLKAGN